ncbi:MAG TPA: bifunctional precorrin-2 dehydrogenase/sirohydrochlorin ferrochelatase [Anaerolineae bacterium]|nr:bifunctional precorrin-2 dehydrogenase/sirohydrochlorin ferrochelatase [Anaerolineae bacterium]
MTGYPITLVGLEAAGVVVIGGGNVAARKVEALCEAGARPVVISPVLCETLKRLADQEEIDVILRPYERGDLRGARLVVAATDDEGTNEAVWREAQATGCLVNVVDDPARCNFYVPATVRRGALTLSVSTGGQSPLLAGRIRRELESCFDEAYEPYVALLGELRSLVQERVPDPARRRALWQALLDSDVLELFRAGDAAGARERADTIVRRYL